MILCEQLVGPELGRDLASNELTGVRRIRKNLTLKVYRGHRRRLYAGLLLSLRDKMDQFEPSLGGVLMSYDGLTVLVITKKQRHRNNIHVTVRANFYVFFTAPGSLLSARIVKKQKDSATAQVNETFKMFISNTVSARHQEGQEITVRVLAVSYRSGVPELVGEAVTATRRQVLAEMERRKIRSLLDTRDDSLTGLEVVEVAGKGRGVRAVRLFSRGEPVVEYVGQLSCLGSSSSHSGERVRALREENNYNFYFQSAGSQYCVDASQETGRFGRLVNHSIVAANTNVKVEVVDNVPRLILFASRDIKTGEELLFDYGDRDKETRAANPWLCV